MVVNLCDGRTWHADLQEAVPGVASEKADPADAADGELGFRV
jgi:hypothetical protein